MELKESLKEWKVVLASASPRRKELLEQLVPYLKEQLGLDDKPAEAAENKEA